MGYSAVFVFGLLSCSLGGVSLESAKFFYQDTLGEAEVVPRLGQTGDQIIDTPY